MAGVPATQAHRGLPMAQREWLIAVYTMSNRKHGRLYIGVSGMLLKRVLEHREGRLEGFTKKYCLWDSE
jgi:predicted GIY-YIG superfamily endonuclease